MIRSLSLRDIALRAFALLLGAQLLSPGRVWAAPPGPEASAMRPDYSSQVILDSIGELEAESDAKCNSTASRFEDFLFGTPLSESARIEKTELQKALVRRLWYAASDKARAKGHSGVTAEHLQEETRSILTESEAPDGTLRVQFPNHPPVEITSRRREQYGSIAYSLRAILAVQQENLLSAEPAPISLTPKATRLLQRSLDLAFLSALQQADMAARMGNEFEISAERIRNAWRSLIPGAENESLPFLLSNDLDAGTQNRLLLDELIDKKVEAYRAYNDLVDRKARALFITNSVRFYARAKIPRSGPARGQIIGAVNRDLDLFSQALLEAAAEFAAERGHGLIRADDALSASRRLLPQKIDIFEDVHVFPNLPGPERVLLEAYDCDSFRDFGIHWQSLRRALDVREKEAISLDPFAAEIMAETISQYGVLILRVAGEIANGRTNNLMLGPADLSASASLVAERARSHPDNPPSAEGNSQIASAPEASTSAKPALFFSDITSAAGLDFEHRSSRWLGEFRHKQVKTPPTFSGGGVAAEDVDGDGHVDVLLVGGAGNALLMNTGQDSFVDMTAEAGLNYQRADGSMAEPRQPIIADFDNDGLQDILITYVNDDHRLYRNLGGRNFSDVSAAAGLGGEGLVGGPATAFDFDGDGLLDIYIGYFGNYLEGDFPAQERDNHTALPNRLFRNLGSMNFEDVTQASGTGDRGWAQAVSHVDFDADGRQDLVVANDYGLNAFLRNLGGGEFRDMAPGFGMDRALHSMNVGTTDINLDGFPDIYISNIATLVKDNKYTFPDVNTPLDFDLRAMSGMLVKEADTFFVSESDEDGFSGYVASDDVERGRTSTGWAWDAEFLDFDHDGDDDLYLVNGTNDYNAFSMIVRNGQQGEGEASLLVSHSRESNVFFRNEKGKLKNRSGESGADFVGNSRSTAFFDFDKDGDLDIVVNNFHSPATLLRNNADQNGHHWLKLRLLGEPEKGSNRDAIGARIEMKPKGGLPNSRIVQGGSGYLSMNPKEQHFGVGSAQFVDVTVTWPNGEKQDFPGLATDRAYTISQASGLREKGVARLPPPGDNG
jgi:enediyne biosynthesis protein E4